MIQRKDNNCTSNLKLAVALLPVLFISSFSYSQERPLRSDDSLQFVTYPVPDGYEQVYLETIRVDEADYLRVGYMDIESGDMLDLILDSDQNRLDRIPLSTNPRQIIASDANKKIAELLSIPQSSANTSITLELDISLGVWATGSSTLSI